MIKISLFVLFLCVFVFPSNCQISKQFISGNFYQQNYFYLLSGGNFLQVNHDAALAACKAQNAYLVTISSEAENTFIRDGTLSANININVYNNIHVSGITEIGNLFEWYFDSGPEKGILMYNLSTDSCYGFCHFSKREPSMGESEIYLSTTSSEAGPNEVYLNNIAANVDKYVLCETGGFENFAPFQPIIDPLTNEYINYVIFQNTSQNFKTAEVKVGIQPCELSEIGVNKYKCLIGSNPPNLDTVSEITIKIGSNIITQYYQCQNILIDFIWISMSTNQFFIKLNTIQTAGGTVKFGSNGTPCTNYDYESNVINCIAVIPNGDTIFPVELNLNNLVTKTFKTTIIDNDTAYSYKFITMLTSFPNVYNNALRFSTMGQSGYAQGVRTLQLSNVAKYSAAIAPYGYWQNIFPCLSSDCVIETGPNKDEIIHVDYPVSNFTINNTYKRYIYYPDTAQNVVSNINAFGNFIVEFGGLTPSFGEYADYAYDGTKVGIRPNLTTSGGYINVFINEPGIQGGALYIDGVNATYNLSPISSNIYHLLVPPGYGSKKLSFISKRNIEASNTLEIFYNQPVVESISPPVVSYIGNYITIKGQSFGNFVSGISVSVDQIEQYTNSYRQCTNITFGDFTNSTIICLVPPAVSISWSKNIHVRVIVGGQKSEYFTMKYSDYPVITSSSPIYNKNINPLTNQVMSNQISIRGNHFVDVSHYSFATNGTEVVVYFTPCTDVKVVNPNLITCFVTIDKDSTNENSGQVEGFGFPIELHFNGFSMYFNTFFLSTYLECPNNCSGEGICDTNLGICNCFPDFGSHDCSLSIVPPPTRPEYGADVSTVISNGFSTFIFKPIGYLYYTNFQLFDPQGWIAETSKYSDRQYVYTGVGISPIRIEINFTINSNSYFFGGQYFQLYPYSTTYKVSYYTDPNELVFQLQYNNTSDESLDADCYTEPSIQTDLKQYYQIKGVDSLYNIKFTKSIEMDYSDPPYAFSTQDITMRETSEYNIPVTDPSMKTEYFTVKSNANYFNVYSQINFALATVSPDVTCSDNQEPENNWKTPLIATVVVVGVIVVVLASIYVIKNKSRFGKIKESIKTSQSIKMSNMSINNNNNSNDSTNIQYIE
ncbi:IPT/TIG domain-containing protein [Tieghemostelium lacteum]|uniref:IPT/TIG domain-containing protein n=1 Tax=Tieghemostelium lacteum TaxID=361077 RepID=A0A151ZKM4_TIELA|nr:IPT/TIG domain-containing protein [Tieghemostelium lacteum]|eukprot:KYQ94469.1 IPT/TIG domain-containing protein [Tieghemostelium lacteum]